jgi:hypothetical protein
MAVKAKQTGTKVVTGEVRFSYVSVFEPREDLSGNLKYSLLILISKTDTDTLNAISAAYQEAVQNGVAKLWKTKPADLGFTLRDGDELADKGEEYEGCYFMRVASNSRPQIVDKNLNPITDETEVYSGCYGAVSMTLFPYDKAGNRGISASLLNVQKLSDGDSLTGRSSAREDFDIIADEAPAALGFLG